MYFTRYEIRWLYQGCFYEGGDSFEYLPFDTLADAQKYAQEHKETCATIKGECSCGIYKVTLFSNSDIATLIKEL